MCADSGLTKDEIQSALAAVHFIFTSAGKYEVSANVLGEEITQLGLPLENATALAKVYSDHLNGITVSLSKDYLRSNFYIVNKFEGLNWKVDYDLITNNTTASLKIIFDKEEIPLVVTSTQLVLLTQELTRAHNIMKKHSKREES